MNVGVRTFRAALVIEELAADGTVLLQRSLVKSSDHPAVVTSSRVAEPATNAYTLARELLADVSTTEMNRLTLALEFAQALSYK